MISALLVGSGRNAKFAVFLGGALWGLFWIPLRALDEAGVTGAWATLAYFLGPAILWLPLVSGRWRRLVAGGPGLALTCAIAAVSLVCYANALIFTEVVRAVLLYYLTPVWSTLLARIFLGEAITPVRLVSIALGIAGLFVILGIDQGLPLPRNLGDWLALGGGVGWAITAVRLRADKVNQAEEITFLYFVIGSVAALAACALPDGRTGPVPDLETVVGVLPWLVPVLVVLIIPSSFLVIWGARLLSPGLVGVLVMSEISIGAGSAALLAGEPFGAREITGVVLISAAGLLDALWHAKGEPAPRG